MMHVSGKKLNRILKVLPKSSAIKKIAGENWYDVSFNCEEKETIPKLKKMGCQGIIEIPLNKVIL